MNGAYFSINYEEETEHYQFKHHDAATDICNQLISTSTTQSEMSDE